MCEEVKSVIVFTKKDGSFRFSSEYGNVYVKEQEDAILVSDRKDFIFLMYCEHTDLKQYKIISVDGTVSTRMFEQNDEDEVRA